MKKYFITSDPHSYYNLLMKSLNKERFDINNQEHIIVICGDLFDRGTETLELYKWIRSIPKERRILIRGNHEYLLRDLVKRKTFYDHDISNGTLTSLLQLNNFLYDNFALNYSLYYEPNGLDQIKACLKKCYTSKITKECLDWIFSDEWVDYYELGNYIFTHTFIPVNLGSNTDLYRPIYDDLSYNKDWRNADKKAFEKATWGCPWRLFDAGLFDEEIKNNKILVCGHWHASDFHLQYEKNTHIVDTGMGKKELENYTPYIGKNLIALDACTAASSKVNIIVLEEQENNDFKLINNNEFKEVITIIKELKNE